MIHVFIGTKAQYIKTAPVCRELIRRGIPYRLIDSGQHLALSGPLRATFELPEPDLRLRVEGRNLSTIPGLLRWFLRWSLAATFRPASIRRRLFADQGGICVVHGDTATTLLSCWLAKRAGLRVAHLEAGLRSRSWWHPFPEELIRLLTMRMADLLFAPNEWAAGNLRAMKLRGRTITLSGNTGHDAVRIVLGAEADAPRTPSAGARPYVVVTTHRAETIFSRGRMRFVIDLLADLAKRFEIRFILHEPTRLALERYGWLDELTRTVQVQPLREYPDFLRLLRGAAFVITDGGSIQEESYYLNLPCCILRMRTERQDGLDGNAVLAEFDRAKIDDFVARHESLRRPELMRGRSPSAEVVEILVEEEKTSNGANPNF